MVAAATVAVRRAWAYRERAWTAVAMMVLAETAAAKLAGPMARALRVAMMVVAQLGGAALAAATEGEAVAPVAGWPECQEDTLVMAVPREERMVLAARAAVTAVRALLVKARMEAGATPVEVTAVAEMAGLTAPPLQVARTVVA